MKPIQPVLQGQQTFPHIGRHTAELADPVVEVGFARLEINLVKGKTGQVGSRFKAQLVPVQLVPVALLIGDVDGDARQMLRLTVGGELDPPAGGDPPQVVLARPDDPVVHLERFPHTLCALDDVPDTVPIVGMDRLHHAREIDRFVGSESEDHPIAVGEPEAARAEVEGPEPGLGGIRRQVHPILGHAQPVDHRLAVQGADEQLAEDPEPGHVGIRPLGLPVHGIENDEVPDVAPGLDRQGQGGPDRHLPPGFPLGLGIRREVGDPRDPDGRALDEQGLAGPGEHLRQVGIRRHLRDALGEGSDPDIHHLLVLADLQQRAPVGPEEDPDPIEGALDDLAELLRRGGVERGGGVGDHRLEFEAALQAIGGGDKGFGHDMVRRCRIRIDHPGPATIGMGPRALGVRTRVGPA